MQRTPRSARARQEKKLKTRNAKLADAAIVGTSTLLVVGLGAAFMQQGQVQARITEAAATYTPPLLSTPTPESSAEATGSPGTATEFAPLTKAIENLEDTSKPWTMTVLGDSTGNDPTEWVQSTARGLAERTGRPAEIHTWSNDSNSYEWEEQISGAGEPIIVWNGSAPGKRARYSIEHQEDMAPEASDLVIISHGLNHFDATDAISEIGNLTDWILGAWESPPALAVTLQNPRLDDRAERQDAIVEALRDAWDDKENVALIDVHSSFNNADDVASLLRDDQFHPNDDGSNKWADTVWSDLNLDAVES